MAQRVVAPRIPEVAAPLTAGTLFQRHLVPHFAIGEVDTPIQTSEGSGPPPTAPADPSHATPPESGTPPSGTAPGQGQPAPQAPPQAAADPRLADLDAREQRITARERAYSERIQALQDRLAQRGRQQGQPPQSQAQPGAQPQTAADLVQAVRSGQLQLDGNTLAALYERIQTEGFGPLQQWGQAINQLTQELRTNQAALQQSVAPVLQSRQEEARNETIESALVSAGVDLDAEPLVEADATSALRELATNVFYGWHPNRTDFETDAQYEAAVSQFSAQFPTLLTTQLDGVRKAARILDRLDAQAARDRLIPSRGGTGAPTGDQPYTFQTPRQLARNFYAAHGGEAT